MYLSVQDTSETECATVTCAPRMSVLFLVARMYAANLGFYVSVRNFTDVKALAAEMKRNRETVTMRARLVVMNTAMILIK